MPLPGDPMLRRPRMVGPEALNDGLEGADSPIEMDPMFVEPNAEELAAEERARDNRRFNAPYEVRQRIRRMAKAAGITREEAEAMLVSEGDVMADPANVDPQSGAMNFQGRTAQFLPLIKASEDARDAAEAERQKTWQSHMMLASGNARGNMVNAFNMLDTDQKQRVIESRLTGGRNYNANDPRIAIAQLDAETRRAEGAAQREHLSNEGKLTREAAAEERQAAREESGARLTAEQATATQRHEALMAQGQQRHEAMMTQLANGNAAAAQAHATELAKITAMIEENRARNDANISGQQIAADAQTEVARINAGATQDKLQNIEDRQNEQIRRADQATAEKEATSFAGPGGAHIVAGNFDTPEAEDSLKDLAARADQTWNGFFTDDAKRLDAMLVRLGVVDPGMRRQLVQKYGINSDIPGQVGRGALSSAWRVAHPEYAPVTPAQ